MQYGGLGGVLGGRPIDEDDQFEILLERLFGDRIRSDDLFPSTFWGESAHLKFANQIWSALTNVEWHHTNGDVANFSFRRAGDLIAAIRREGDYLDWYCNSDISQVSEEIAQALAAEGWTYTLL
jgi:hypothetical protein